MFLARLPLALLLSAPCHPAEIVTQTVTLLRCPAVQSPEDRGDKWRNAYLEVADLGDRWWPGNAPSFVIDGAYVFGKVLCDLHPGECSGRGNAKGAGKLVQRGSLLILTQPVHGENLEFVCELAKRD